MKVCKQCGIKKPLDAFSPDKNGLAGRQSRCKPCRTWNKNNKYDPEYKRKYDLKIQYDISLEQYDEMLKAQGGCCAVCGNNTPDGKGRFVVDHCHETGRVRGLLCTKCNVMLGMAKDSVSTLMSAVNYLRLTR